MVPSAHSGRRVHDEKSTSVCIPVTQTAVVAPFETWGTLVPLLCPLVAPLEWPLLAPLLTAGVFVMLSCEDISYLTNGGDCEIRLPSGAASHG